MKSFFTLLSFCLMTLTISAQIGGDCDCDFNPDDTFVCATDADGNIVPVPNECFADCFGLTILEGDCDEILGGSFPDGDYPEDDWGCDCEIDPAADFVCAADSTGYICPVPNACIAECYGLTVVEEECDDFWGDFPEDGDWEDPCDCEVDPEAEFICASDESGNVFFVESECIALCFGLTVVDGGCDDIWDNEDGDWDDEDWYSDCDCEVDYDEPFICASDEFGNIFPIENACIAECFGLTVVEGDCDEFWGGDWEDDYPDTDWGCDCEIDPEAEWVCASDSTGYICPVPNECVAECYGLTVVEGECDNTWDGDDWYSDCDCEIDYNEPFICASDEFGNIFPIENACIAECFGLTVVEDEDCGGDWDDGDVIVLEDDCGCDFNEEENLCVTDGAGNVFPFPNECLANCFGLTIVDCDDADGDNANNTSTHKLSKATENFGTSNITDFNNQLIQASNNTLISNSLEVFPNPVSSDLNFTIDLKANTEATVSVINMAGQMVSQQQVALSKGNNSETLNVSDLDAGIYHISVTTTSQTMNTKFIKM